MYSYYRNETPVIFFSFPYVEKNIDTTWNMVE